MKNKKEKINLRKFLFLLPLLLLTLTTTVAVTYAYWNMLQYQEAHNIELGQGVVLSVDVVASAPAGKTLVPTGQVFNPATQVDEIVLSYNVGLDQDASSVGELEATVVASAIAIGGDTDLGALYVKVAISPDTFELSTTDTVVTVTITLNEPEDQAGYEAIAGKAITFTLTFSTALA